MGTTKTQTETYVLQKLDRLDPVTAYVTNAESGVGQGKIVIECYSKAWACYWGGMGERSLQEFFISCDNAYILNRMLEQTTQTDFDEINKLAEKKGFDICVTSDVEVAMSAVDMDKCFGSCWMMDLPTCNTSDYEYVGRIVDALREAFTAEINAAA